MIVKEGKVKIFAPYVNEKGPGKVEGVFYNREMVFNRDSTIFLLHNIRVKNALDALAATGVRGLRIAREIGMSVTINDSNPDAYRIIKMNVEMNDVDAEIVNRDANSLMAERRFDYVDIDPFGTPVPFIDMSLRCARIIGISATDTATLSGRKKKIETRYLAKIDRMMGNHEIGIRVLLGYIARMAARFDLGIEPILSFWWKHSYRVYVRLRKGMKYARKSLETVKMTELGGPLWVGDIHDLDFLRNAKIPDLPSGKVFKKYLELWKNEKFFLYYDISKICSELRVSQPPIEEIIEELKNMGFEVYRTHFSPQGVRTDAPKGEIERVILNLSPNG